MKFLRKLTVIFAVAVCSTQLFAAEGDDSNYSNDDMQNGESSMNTNSDIPSNPDNPGVQPDQSGNPGVQPDSSSNPGLQPEGQ